MSAGGGVMVRSRKEPWRTFALNRPTILASRRAPAGEPETLYVDTCCHMNRQGYEIIAREIVRTIRQGLPSPRA